MPLSLAAATALALAVPAAPPPVIETVTAAQDGTSNLVHELVVAAPPGEVWRAVATLAGWKTWAVPVGWAVPGEPDIIETSYDPAAKPGDPGNIRNQFIVRLPDRLLVFRVAKAPAGLPNADALARVVNVFELTPAGAGTRVRLTGTGFPDSPGGKAMLGFFRQGNRISLEKLRIRFEKGPIDWTAERKGPTGK